jgi:hypothetical protein
MFGFWRRRIDDNADEKMKASNRQMLEVGQVIGQLKSVTGRLEEVADQLVDLERNKWGNHAGGSSKSSRGSSGGSPQPQ